MADDTEITNVDPLSGAIINAPPKEPVKNVPPVAKPIPEAESPAGEPTPVTVGAAPTVAPPAAPLPSWSEVTQSKTYQNANDTDRLKLLDNYTEQARTAGRQQALQNKEDPNLYDKHVDAFYEREKQAMETPFSIFENSAKSLVGGGISEAAKIATGAITAPGAMGKELLNAPDLTDIGKMTVDEAAVQRQDLLKGQPALEEESNKARFYLDNKLKSLQNPEKYPMFPGGQGAAVNTIQQANNNQARISALNRYIDSNGTDAPQPSDTDKIISGIKQLPALAEDAGKVDEIYKREHPKLNGFLNGAGRTLPFIVGAAASGGALTVPGIATEVAMTTSDMFQTGYESGQEKVNERIKNGENIPAYQAEKLALNNASLTAFGVGSWQTASNLILSTALEGVHIPAGATVDGFVNNLKNFLLHPKNLVPETKAIAEVGAQAGIQAGAQLTSNLAMRASGVSPDQSLTEGVPEAAGQGAAFGIAGLGLRVASTGVHLSLESARVGTMADQVRAHTDALFLNTTDTNLTRESALNTVLNETIPPYYRDAVRSKIALQESAKDQAKVADNLDATGSTATADEMRKQSDQTANTSTVTPGSQADRNAQRKARLREKLAADEAARQQREAAKTGKKPPTGEEAAPPPTTKTADEIAAEAERNRKEGIILKVDENGNVIQPEKPTPTAEAAPTAKEGEAAPTVTAPAADAINDKINQLLGPDATEQQKKDLGNDYLQNSVYKNKSGRTDIQRRAATHLMHIFNLLPKSGELPPRWVQQHTPEVLGEAGTHFDQFLDQQIAQRQQEAEVARQEEEAKAKEAIQVTAMPPGIIEEATRTNDPENLVDLLREGKTLNLSDDDLEKYEKFFDDHKDQLRIGQYDQTSKTFPILPVEDMYTPEEAAEPSERDPVFAEEKPKFAAEVTALPEHPREKEYLEAASKQMAGNKYKLNQLDQYSTQGLSAAMMKYTKYLRRFAQSMRDRGFEADLDQSPADLRKNAKAIKEKTVLTDPETGEPIPGTGLSVPSPYTNLGSIVLNYLRFKKRHISEGMVESFEGASGFQAAEGKESSITDLVTHRKDKLEKEAGITLPSKDPSAAIDLGNVVHEFAKTLSPEDQNALWYTIEQRTNGEIKAPEGTTPVDESAQGDILKRIHAWGTTRSAAEARLEKAALAGLRPKYGAEERPANVPPDIKPGLPPGPPEGGIPGQPGPAGTEGGAAGAEPGAGEPGVREEGAAVTGKPEELPPAGGVPAAGEGAEATGAGKETGAGGTAGGERGAGAERPGGASAAAGERTAILKEPGATTAAPRPTTGGRGAGEPPKPIVPRAPIEEEEAHSPMDVAKAMFKNPEVAEDYDIDVTDYKNPKELADHIESLEADMVDAGEDAEAWYRELYSDLGIKLKKKKTAPAKAPTAEKPAAPVAPAAPVSKLTAAEQSVFDTAVNKVANDKADDLKTKPDQMKAMGIDPYASKGDIVVKLGDMFRGMTKRAETFQEKMEILQNYSKEKLPEAPRESAAPAETKKTYPPGYGPPLAEGGPLTRIDYQTERPWTGTTPGPEQPPPPSAEAEQQWEAVRQHRMAGGRVQDAPPIQANELPPEVLELPADAQERYRQMSPHEKAAYLADMQANIDYRYATKPAETTPAQEVPLEVTKERGLGNVMGAYGPLDMTYEELDRAEQRLKEMQREIPIETEATVSEAPKALPAPVVTPEQAQITPGVKPTLIAGEGTGPRRINSLTMQIAKAALEHPETAREWGLDVDDAFGGESYDPNRQIDVQHLADHIDTAMELLEPEQHLARLENMANGFNRTIIEKARPAPVQTPAAITHATTEDVSQKIINHLRNNLEDAQAYGLVGVNTPEDLAARFKQTLRNFTPEQINRMITALGQKLGVIDPPKPPGGTESSGVMHSLAPGLTAHHFTGEVNDLVGRLRSGPDPDMQAFAISLNAHRDNLVGMPTRQIDTPAPVVFYRDGELWVSPAAVRHQDGEVAIANEIQHAIAQRKITFPQTDEEHENAAHWNHWHNELRRTLPAALRDSVHSLGPVFDDFEAGGDLDTRLLTRDQKNWLPILYAAYKPENMMQMAFSNAAFRDYARSINLGGTTPESGTMKPLGYKAAIRLPNGMIHTGATHEIAYSRAGQPHYDSGAEYGFTDKNGKFISYPEADKIMEQMKGDTLYGGIQHWANTIFGSQGLRYADRAEHLVRDRPGIPARFDPKVFDIRQSYPLTESEKNAQRAAAKYELRNGPAAMLRQVAALSDNPRHATIAKALLEAVEAHPRIKTGLEDRIGGIAGGYDFDADRVTVNPHNNDSSIEASIIHELVHALTLGKIDAFEQGQVHLLTAQDMQNVSELERLRQIALKSRGVPNEIRRIAELPTYRQREKAMMDLIQRRPDMANKFYGLTDTREFASEVLSNGQLQDHLARIPYQERGEKPQSMLQKAFSWVRKFLGFKDNTALSSAFDSVVSLMGGRRVMESDFETGSIDGNRTMTMQENLLAKRYLDNRAQSEGFKGADQVPVTQLNDWLREFRGQKGMASGGDPYKPRSIAAPEMRAQIRSTPELEAMTDPKDIIDHLAKVTGASRFDTDAMRNVSDKAFKDKAISLTQYLSMQEGLNELEHHTFNKIHIDLGKKEDSDSVISRFQHALNQWRPQGSLPKELYNAILEHTKYSSQATALEIRNRVEELRKAVAKNYKGAALTPKVNEDITRMLAGDATISRQLMPVDVVNAIDAMRESIDSRSDDIIMSNMVSRKKAIVLTNNIGKYITRTYRFFDDPRYIFRPESMQYRAAAEAEADNMLQGPDRVAEAKRVAKNAGENAARAFTPGTTAYKNAYDTAYNTAYASAKNNIGKHFLDRKLQEWQQVAKNKQTNNLQYGHAYAVDDKLLRELTSMPENIRKLIGEERDPSAVFMKTVWRQQNFLNSVRLSRDIVELGRRGGYISDRMNGRNTREIPDGFKHLGELRGKYTTPEIAAALTDYNHNLRQIDEGPVWSIIRSLESNARYLATIGSLQRTAANAHSAVFSHLNNGYFNVLNPQSWKAAGDVFTGQLLRMNNPQREELLMKLNRLGLSDKESNVNHVMDFLTHGPHINSRTPLDFMEQFSQWKRKAGELPGVSRAGEAMTDLHTVWNFVSKASQFFQQVEKERAFNDWDAKHGLAPKYSQDELEKRAAQVVRETNISYSRVSPIVARMRRNPVVGTFLTFAEQSLQSFAYSGIHAFRNLFSKNPVRRMDGVLRLGGMMTSLAIPLALQEMSKKMMNVSSQEDDNFRKLLPPWEQNNMIVYGPKDGTKRSYWNASYSTTQSDISRAIHALLAPNDHGIMGKVFGAASEIFHPALNLGLIPGALVDTMRNQTEYGTQVYNPDETWQNIAGDLTKYMLSRELGGTLGRTGSRIVPGGLQFTGGTVSPGGAVYNIWTGLTPEITGFQIKGVSMPERFKSELYSSKDSIQNAERIFTGPIQRSGNELTDDQMHSLYQRQEDARRNVFNTLHEKILAARFGGMSTQSIKDALKIRRYSHQEIDDLMSGRYRPYRPSETVLKNARANGNFVPNNLFSRSTAPYEEQEEEEEEGE